jgi:hypothetical protein
MNPTDTLDLELYVMNMATWRIEMFLEAWVGAPAMTPNTLTLVDIARAELATRN